MGSTTVLVWSRYSSKSKTLIDMINNSPVPLEIQALCADHKTVRDLIIANDKIQIKFVPCILNIHQTGVVEQYEGSQAFDYIRSVITAASQSCTMTEQPMYSQPEQNFVQSQKQVTITEQTHAQQVQQPQVQQTQSHPAHHDAQSAPQGMTSIDDIPLIDDVMEHDMANGTGNAVIENFNGEVDENEGMDMADILGENMDVKGVIGVDSNSSSTTLKGVRDSAQDRNVKGKSAISMAAQNMLAERKAMEESLSNNGQRPVSSAYD